MLTIYRRHLRTCKSGHPEELRTSEFDERKKGWKRCQCPIFASGTLAGKSQRRNTGQWEWEPARAAAATLDQAGTWNSGERPSTVPVVLRTPQIDTTTELQRVTVLEATEAFLAACQNRGIAVPTFKKYQTFIKQFRAYCDARGYLLLDQLKVIDADLFYASWKDAKRAKAKKLERFKSFIKFCINREWIEKDMTRDLKPPEGASIAANKTPFTDKELDRIFAACDQLGPPRPPGPGHRPYGGDDLRDFIYLSLYTGLRISDVATFNIAERLEGNNVFLRMHKTQKELYTWIPTWLVTRLRDREKRHGSLIFRAGAATNMRAMSERWRDNLNRVFKLAGPWKERPHHHKFRHTFVRILLEKGISVADVAELIGDTPEVVARHYSKWVTSRQERLTNILKDAFDDRPAPITRRRETN